jgi:hypothetical protein
MEDWDLGNNKPKFTVVKIVDYYKRTLLRLFLSFLMLTFV